MSEFPPFIQQFIDWLVRTWQWLVATAIHLWQRVPYHAEMTRMVEVWYTAGYITIAAMGVVVLWMLWMIRRWALAVVMRTNYHHLCILRRHLRTVMRFAHDQPQRNILAMTAARRTFRQYFYTYQRELTPDNELRRTMRDLVNHIDAHAVAAHHDAHYYLDRMDAVIETQRTNYPRRIRWLYWIIGGR